jgi:hypothetical protein
VFDDAVLPFSIHTPASESCTARTDGTRTSHLDDPGVTHISFRKLGEDFMLKICQRDGKFTSVDRVTVAADGPWPLTPSSNNA